MSETPDAQTGVFAPTRPNVASRKARRGREQRKVTRYTLDLETTQHQWLRLWSLQEGVEASKLCRALLFICENDEALKERVLDEIFAEEEGNLDPEA